MTKKSRNWLILFLFIPTAAILAIAGLLIFQKLQLLPPIQPLPHPNGYDDLVQAAHTVPENSGDCDKMNQTELREWVAKNTAALSLMRTGLSNECKVPIQFSQTYIGTHLNELEGLKRLSQALVAEGRLAEMENRSNDALKSYLDAIHMGNKIGRGGILIDELVGVAVEASGTGRLQKLVDKLDAKSCRETAATLETLDAQRQSWTDILQQANAWSRRTFSGLRYRLAELMASGPAKKKNQTRDAQNAVERKFKKQQANTRQLMIELATRAYDLEKNQPPASLADLVPDYLKAIPLDPFTGTNLVYSPR